MGWLYGWNTKAAMLAHLLDNPGNHKTLARSIRGNNAWCVKEYEKDGKPVRYIALFMLAGRGGGNCAWGYKDVEEGMGPSQLDCPVKFFDMVPDPGGYATEWRARVRAELVAKAEKRKALKALAIGQTVKLRKGYSLPEVTITNVKPLRGAYGGTTYRLRPGQLDFTAQA